MAARKLRKLPIKPTPTDADPQSWLYLNPSGPSPAGTVFAVLRRTYAGRVNSALEFGYRKAHLGPVAPGADLAAWSPNVERIEVLLPAGADDSLADPATLLGQMDAHAVEREKALLTYLTLPLGDVERVHVGWERARAFRRRTGHEVELPRLDPAPRIFRHRVVQPQRPAEHIVPPLQIGVPEHQIVLDQLFERRPRQPRRRLEIRHQQPPLQDHRRAVVRRHAIGPRQAVQRHRRLVPAATRVQQLAEWKGEAERQTAQLMAQALADNAARQARDNDAARRAAEAAQSAALAMEKADAEAERRNLVDREWFAAVNHVAGLRAPH